MPADPIVWTDEAQPGKMKHSFTGLRHTFPNRAVHYLIMDCIIPIRIQLLSRPEAKSIARWEAPLATFCQQALEGILTAIRIVTHESATTELPALKARMDAEQAFVAKVKLATTTVESLAQDPAATHTDQLLGPASSRIATLHFDWVGTTDANLAQPTPNRVPNTDLRSFIIELDRLVVEMTGSPSADHPRTVNERDAAIWAARLADMFTIVSRASSKQQPYLPTAVTRGMLDQVFNANGEHDPDLNSGGGTQGEPTSPAATKS